jgi:hypothetical protein
MQILPPRKTAGRRQGVAGCAVATQGDASASNAFFSGGIRTKYADVPIRRPSNGDPLSLFGQPLKNIVCEAVLSLAAAQIKKYRTSTYTLCLQAFMTIYEVIPLEPTPLLYTADIIILV